MACSNAREGFFMPPPMKDTSWKTLPVFKDKFVPFRVFTSLTNNSTEGYWKSWFVSHGRGILWEFRSREPERITDDVVPILQQEEGLRRLNVLEENDYRERITSLTLSELKEQRRLWQELRARKSVRIEYPPIEMLATEIQEKLIIELRGLEAKHSETVRPTTEQKSPVIKKSLMEKCSKECERREIPKNETITTEEKYSIAKAINLKGLGTIETFRPRNPAYHHISKILSELGYSRKDASKYK